MWVSKQETNWHPKSSPRNKSTSQSVASPNHSTVLLEVSNVRVELHELSPTTPMRSHFREWLNSQVISTSCCWKHNFNRFVQGEAVKTKIAYYYKRFQIITFGIQRQHFNLWQSATVLQIWYYRTILDHKPDLNLDAFTVLISYDIWYTTTFLYNRFKPLLNISQCMWLRDSMRWWHWMAVSLYQKNSLYSPRAQVCINMDKKI